MEQQHNSSGTNTGSQQQQLARMMQQLNSSSSWAVVRLCAWRVVIVEGTVRNVHVYLHVTHAQRLGEVVGLCPKPLANNIRHYSHASSEPSHACPVMDTIAARRALLARQRLGFDVEQSVSTMTETNAAATATASCNDANNNDTTVSAQLPAVAVPMVGGDAPPQSTTTPQAPPTTTLVPLANVEEIYQVHNRNVRRCIRADAVLAAAAVASIPTAPSVAAPTEPSGSSPPTATAVTAPMILDSPTRMERSVVVLHSNDLAPVAIRSVPLQDVAALWNISQPNDHEATAAALVRRQIAKDALQAIGAQRTNQEATARRVATTGPVAVHATKITASLFSQHQRSTNVDKRKTPTNGNDDVMMEDSSVDESHAVTQPDYSLDQVLVDDDTTTPATATPARSDNDWDKDTTPQSSQGLQLLSCLALQPWTTPRRQRPAMDQSTNEGPNDTRPVQASIPQRLLLSTTPATVRDNATQGHEEVANMDTHDTLLSQPPPPRAGSPPSVAASAERADRSVTRQSMADTPAMSNITTVGGLCRGDGAEERLETQPSPPSSQLVFHYSNGPSRPRSSSRRATTRCSTAGIDKGDASRANVVLEQHRRTPDVVSVNESIDSHRETSRNKASTATISRKAHSFPPVAPASGVTGTRRTKPLESNNTARPVVVDYHSHRRGRPGDDVPPVRAKIGIGQEQAQPPRIRLAGDFIRAWFRV
jgi:hypothetical protein